MTNLNNLLKYREVKGGIADRNNGGNAANEGGGGSGANGGDAATSGNCGGGGGGGYTIGEVTVISAELGEMPQQMHLLPLVSST